MIIPDMTILVENTYENFPKLGCKNITNSNNFDIIDSVVFNASDADVNRRRWSVNLTDTRTTNSTTGTIINY